MARQVAVLEGQLLLARRHRLPVSLHALRALHVPSVLTATMSFMVRYLYVLLEETSRLQTARAARSAGPGGSVAWRARVLGGMVGTLFIRSYERSERIYAAMLARGYAGEIQTLTRLEWQPRDSWTALAWGVALGAVLLLARLLPIVGGSLP
jgi:cobalt/nickel transport system permease protein